MQALRMEQDREQLLRHTRPLDQFVLAVDTADAHRQADLVSVLLDHHLVGDEEVAEVDSKKTASMNLCSSTKQQ